MNSKDIRQSFVEFFTSRGHRHHKSAPLVPQGDPTLLFTNAGMVQFKNFFLGVETPENRRAVTSQKCLRVSGKHNDLENVGPSPRHHTFFEMLGNFSFGDYFKEEAIEFAWELVTKGWGLSPKHLFATVFEQDDEAESLWLRISGLPAARVIRCGAEDNFWAMGETGPCGPCSEIFVDRSPSEPEVPFLEGSESGRYLEIWNLVFMQFDRAEAGTMTPLPRPSIDTGSGLERVSAALQRVESNYDTDLFQPLLAAAAERAGVRYGEHEERDISMRVIADHIRAVAFLLADGVIPSNEGRGYVLRRVLRRAVRHGMRLGLEEPFLGDLLTPLELTLGATYPELAATHRASAGTIRAEEEKFLSTVAAGARQVQEAIESAKRDGLRRLPGEVVFRLYDTHGLPLETVREIAEEEQLGLDEEAAESALAEQRERSRSATSELQGAQQGLGAALRADGELPATRFRGYDQHRLEGAEVLRVVRFQDGRASAAQSLESGQRGALVLDRTVFYAESGGQVADLGRIASSDAALRVDAVHKDASGVFVHQVEVLEGSVTVGDRVDLSIDAERRLATERHHTATHLLHAALRGVLGEGVRQAGSLVHPERLRFDFTHAAPLSDDERVRIERAVNAWARESVPLQVRERPLQEALDAGAMALFGEKYSEVVRTVDVPGISLELCGGCHVANTGAVGPFVITSERGVASGVRRIEALAGEQAERWQRDQAQRLMELEQLLGAPSERLVEEVTGLRARLRELEKELTKARMQLMTGGGGEPEDDTDQIDGVKVLVREVPLAPGNELRNLADVLRNKLGSGVVVVGARGEDKVALLAAVTKDLEGRVHAGQLARAMGDAVGGSGGGRPDFAQAGGKDPARLEEAFSAARASIGSQLAQVEAGV